MSKREIYKKLLQSGIGEDVLLFNLLRTRG